VVNHHIPGEHTLSEEPEPSWRPQDPELPDERSRAGEVRDESGGGGEPRDARWWDSDEEPGRSGAPPDGQRAERASDRSGASDGTGAGRYAGQYGESRLRELPRGPRCDGRPSAGSVEDRHHELGTEAGIGAWPDHTGSDPWRYASQSAHRGRDFEPERHGLSAVYGQRTGYTGALGQGGDERIGEVHVHRETGPHRGKGPAGYQRSDERIRELVCESLTDDDEIDASSIEVSVSSGEVTLSGTVDGRRTKRAAEDCAYSVPGVRDVQNRLRVGDDRASRSNPSGGAVVDPHKSSAHGSKRRA
jgi:hypothetical protein